jgi:hypothetical protein
MKTNKISKFTPRKVRRAVTGEIARDGHAYRVTFPRASGKKVVNYYYNFSHHPFKNLLAKYLFKDAEEVTAATLNGRCKVLELLEEFLSSAGESDLNPETFTLYIRWLLESKKSDGGRRFKDSTIPSYVNVAKAFYRFGLKNGQRGWNQRDLDDMTTVVFKSLRGCRERGAQDSIDRALSFQTFSDLAKAVALEFEQCKQVFREWKAGNRDSPYNFKARFMGIIDPNPLVVFALQAVMRHGLRAEELNALTSSDLNVDEVRGNHEIYVHAPNKMDDYIPVDEAFLTSWQLCEAWSQEARRIVGPEGVQLFKDVLFVYPPTNSHHSHPLMQFSSYMLNQSHLPYFLKKWFGYKVRGEDGNERPLLHAEDDATRPLEIDYDKLRNAFAVRFAEREKNRAVTSRVMRHKQLTTAERYYLHQTRLDHAKKVQIALKSEAVFLAMNLKNPVAAGVSEETLRRAKETGAVLPHGLCGSALEGQDCQRASNCLECPFLVVIESRRSRFVDDREAYLEEGRDLEAAGDWRGAENALSRAKVCEAHLIRMDNLFPEEAG